MKLTKRERQKITKHWRELLNNDRLLIEKVQEFNTPKKLKRLRG